MLMPNILFCFHYLCVGVGTCFNLIFRMFPLSSLCDLTITQTLAFTIDSKNLTSNLLALYLYFHYFWIKHLHWLSSTSLASNILQIKAFDNNYLLAASDINRIRPFMVEGLGIKINFLGIWTFSNSLREKSGEFV